MKNETSDVEMESPDERIARWLAFLAYLITIPALGWLMAVLLHLYGMSPL